MNIVDFFTSKTIAANFNEYAAKQEDYLHEALFPHRKKAGLDLEWMKGAKGLPISLMPTAFDAKATLRDRIGIEKIATEMPFFREGYKLKEKDRQELLRAQDSNDPYAQQVIDFIFDDTNELIRGANVVPEREAMALLFPEDGNSQIVFTANGVDYSYNYDPDGTWKTNNYFELASTDKWDAPSTADPVATFETVQDAIASINGTRPNLAIMNTATFRKLCATEAIIERVNPVAKYATRTEVLKVIGDYNGLDIIVFDGKYKDEDRTVKQFIPDGYVALVPNDGRPIGYTFYGTTPEEADLMGSTDADVTIVNEGLAITVYTEKHPVNVNTIASEIVLPTFERMDECACIKVY